jgi:hypothetical protein
MDKLAVNPVLTAVLRGLRMPARVDMQPGRDHSILMTPAVMPPIISPAIGF